MFDVVDGVYEGVCDERATFGGGSWF